MLCFNDCILEITEFKGLYIYLDLDNNFILRTMNLQLNSMQRNKQRKELASKCSKNENTDPGKIQVIYVER